MKKNGGYRRRSTPPQETKPKKGNVMNSQTMTMDDFTIGSGFNFQGANIDDLGATEYTLVTIALDVSGSVMGQEDQIRNMLIAAVEACVNSDRAQNLMVRAVQFSSMYPNGVDELFGFTPLSQLDSASFPQLRAGGGTPLCDAVYSSVGAMNVYAKDLNDMDFDCNGITFVITDGGENTSTSTVTMVKTEIEKSVSEEIMESHVTVLIGIGAAGSYVEQLLLDFQTNTGIDEFRWAGDATPGNLAKLAQFVSNSISSTSQALGTGGPSQNISATI